MTDMPYHEDQQDSEENNEDRQMHLEKQRERLRRSKASLLAYVEHLEKWELLITWISPESVK